MITKRSFDFVCSAAGLFLLFPLFILVGLWIKVDSPGPVFFRQERVGKNGNTFSIYKFRTMSVNAESNGPLVTTSIDSRITKVGSHLRKYKLDELPQLINVLKGDMSLVGPRPEVPKYVAHYPDDIKKVVLSVAPGITDNASIAFRNENDLLSDKSNPELFYTSNILPMKLKMYEDYVKNRSMIGDILLILRTIFHISA